MEDPMKIEPGSSFTDNINHDSLHILSEAKLEPGLATAKAGDSYQFMRQGYFVVDPDSTPDHPVFNQTVTLRDTWAKLAQKT